MIGVVVDGNTHQSSGRPRAARPRWAPMVRTIRTILQQGDIATLSLLVAKCRMIPGALSVLFATCGQKATFVSFSVRVRRSKCQQMPHGILEPLIRHRKRDAQMACRGLAKAFARHDRHVMFLQQGFGKCFA